MMTIRPTKFSKSTILFLTPLLLGGCDIFSSSKVPLSGTREAIFDNDMVVKPVVLQSVAAVNVPKGQHNKSWPVPGGTLSNSLAPLALSENLTKKWSTSIGHGHNSDKRFTANVIVDNGLIFTFDTSGVVKAFHLAQGHQAWFVSTTPTDASADALGGGIAAHQGNIYVTTSFGEVFALRQKDGEVLWKRSLQTPFRIAPTVANGKIFAVNIANETHALDMKTGETAWTHAGLPESTGILGGATPAISDDTLVVPYSSGEIYALNIQSGTPKWVETLTPALSLDSLSSISHIRARPVLYHNAVYTISYGGRLGAFDLRTGQRYWQRELAGIRTPAVFDNYLYLITLNNELVCLNRQNGEIVWSNPLQSVQSKEKITWAGPVLAGGHLVMTGSNGTIAFHSPKDGRVVHNLEGGDAYSLSPIVVDGHLITLSDSATLTVWG